jgi:crotonobetainyl-CoA:carnitine CoA-transferase CaiB-like acyl-CoA transferase
MTGPPGRPLRAGASIIDILGAVFGVTAVLAALRERDATGQGQRVCSSLFESAVFLMGSHMAGLAATGEAPPPMPARRGAWGIYDVFRAADGAILDQVNNMVADPAPIVPDTVGDVLWRALCPLVASHRSAEDRLKSTQDRLDNRRRELDKLRVEVEELEASLTRLRTESRDPARDAAREGVREPVRDTPRQPGRQGL